MLVARAFFAVLLVCAVTLGGISWGAGSTIRAQEPSGIGVPLPVANEEGVPVGSVTVAEIIDPFTEFNPDYPPEAGFRFVVANVAFDADAGQRFDIQPWTIVLQDDAGFLWNQASLVLPSDAQVPVLSSETLSPGSRITGAVGFVMPEERTPARIFYQPVSSRIVPLVDLHGAPAPVVGDDVPLPDSLGGIGSVRVTGIVDPQDDLDPIQVAPAETRFVQVMLVFENPSDGSFFIEPYGLLLRDANGDLWYSSNVTRIADTKIIPDITGAQLGPGDRLSAAVSFAVPEGVDVTGLYATPVSGQLVQLADFQGAEQGGMATPEVAAEGAEEMKPETAAAEVAVDPCAALETWLVATRVRIARAGEMSVEDATLADLEALEGHAAEFAALASEQLAEATPDAALAVNKALAATLNAYGGALRQILDAEEPGKDTDAEVTEGMNTFNAAGARIRAIEVELAALAQECGLP